jgi:biotin carboxyl carrier protein
MTYTVHLAGREYAVDVDASGRWSIDGADGHPVVERTAPGEYAVVLRGERHRIVARRTEGGYLVLLEGTQCGVTVETERTRLIRKYARAEGTVEHRLEIHAPMPALVGRLLVAPGESVCAGQTLLVLEAMKMENEIKSHRNAKVKEITVAPGRTVEKGQLLIILEQDGTDGS